MFLEKVKRLKFSEVEALDPCTFGERKKGILNPVVSLKTKPVIAEVKIASPSAGIIKEVDPVLQARRYEAGGAGSVSVLVDSQFFNGSWENLQKVASSVKIPVLCKEFVVSKRQIDLAYNSGADFILFICGLLEKEHLQELIHYARSLGLYTLVEVFEETHLEVALSLEGVDMVGVNSRNLNDLSVDLKRAASMLKEIPKDRFKVAESGIKSVEDVKFLLSAGADAFLIGEFLMRSKNPEKLIGEINRVCEGMRNKKY